MNNLTKNKQLALTLSLLAALGGIFAAVRYYESKELRAMTKKIAALDVEIKSHQLNKLKSGNV